MESEAYVPNIERRGNSMLMKKVTAKKKLRKDNLHRYDISIGKCSQYFIPLEKYYNYPQEIKTFK